MTRPDHNSSFSRGTSRTALVVVGVLALLGLAYAILRVDILRARIVVLQNSSKTLEDSNRQLQMRLEELLKTQQGNTIQLNQMQTELANTHEQLGGLRDGVTPAMQQWARIEAVYLLRIARDQLQLGHDVDSATHSLAAALTALNGHGETEAVQRQLIQQLQQLRELPVAEYARAQQQLQQSALIVAQLPLRKPHLLDSVRETLPESDLARGWAQLQHALSSLISVHNDASPALNDAT
ncbi:MAG: uroporphyrinogen-III C-methyltransferase, partial [Steroidobacteraceae bacterium]